MNATRALEESFGNIDNLSVIEDAHKRNSLASSAKTVIIKETPPQSLDLEPRGENPITSSIMPTLSAPAPSTSSTVSTSSIITPNSKHVHYHQRPPVPPRSQEPWYNAGIYGHYHGPVTRDEGDGRSMTDSQYRYVMFVHYFTKIYKHIFFPLKNLLNDGKLLDDFKIPSSSKNVL